MRRYTRGTLVFTAVMSLLAGGAAWAAVLLGPDRPSQWSTFTFLTSLAAITQLYPVKSAKEGVVYVVANAFIFSGVMLLPPWQLSLMCAAALAPVTIKGAKRPGAFIRFAFNSAQTVLASLAAWALVEFGRAWALGNARDVAWVALAIAAFVTIQLTSVAAIVALNTKTHILRTQVFTLQAVMVDSITPFFGALMASIWYDHPWVLALSTVPVIVTYRLMRHVQLVTLADIDPKTGLYNFRYFQDVAQEELRRSASLRRSVAILFCDLDYLREVNNNYGHLAGDKVLEQVAALLLRELPNTAIVSRFGGEEFVAMLPGVDKEEAFHLAERLRRAVGHHPFAIGQERPIHVTLCIGVSGAPLDGTNLTLLAERADQALYQAKNAGRNRCCAWQGRMTAAADQEAPPDEESPPSAADDQQAAGPTPPVAELAPHQTPAPPSRRRNPTRAIVIAAGCAAVTYGLTGIGPHYPWHLLAVCMAAGVLAELLDVRLLLPTKHAASVSPAVAAGLAAGALLGPSGGVLVALASASAHAVRNRTPRLLQFLFNASLAALSNFASGLIFQLAGTAHTEVLGLSHLATAPAATVINFLVNTLLLSAAVTRESRPLSFLLWWESFAWLAPQYVLTGLTGLFAVLAYRLWGPIGALFGGFVVVAAHFSVTSSVWRHQKALGEAIRSQEHLEGLHLTQRMTLDQWTQALARIIDARDGSMRGHSQKVARYATALAEELGVPAEEVDAIRMAALLHDLGKVSLPEHILRKPSRLSPDEWVIMREHAALGQRLLCGIAGLGEVAVMVGEHHERFDGKGYPHGRSGAQLTLGGRIITLADALDTMLSGRPYASPRTPESALGELQACAGKQFDPVVVEALGRLIQTRGPKFVEAPADQLSESESA
ncbi:MAG TPA: diguanylate cyclase [Symbiobacteriaceae bacterium]|nr:diguanylate cyclase [Symbiobacteriaceae bacterium]